MVVVATLKYSMMAGSASSGGKYGIYNPSESSNKLPEPLLDGPGASEHMSVLLPWFKFPASSK